MFLRKLLLFLYSLYAMITFVAVMLLIFPFVIIASFFGRIRGGNMVYRLCCLWADIWFPLVGMWPRKIYEAPYNPEKSYIYVCNHTSYLDSALLVKAFRRPARPLGKVEMSKIPVFGFIYRNAIVTVDRSNPENRAKSLVILRSILKKGISVVVFPEGTFNMSSEPLLGFYDGAFRIALETQTPIRPVLFLDNLDRMHYKSIFAITPGKCRIVYLPEISVEGLGTQDVALLKARTREIMEQKLREYKAGWIR